MPRDLLGLEIMKVTFSAASDVFLFFSSLERKEKFKKKKKSFHVA